MKKKSYLVVGASSGIGEACARHLADENKTLVLVARSAQKLGALAQSLPGTIYPITYDLHDLNHIQEIFDVCKQKDLCFDGMVYCAGISFACPIKVNSVEKMQELMTVNYFAFVETSRLFYRKQYSHEGASIVAISSFATQSFDKGLSAYTASKAALNSTVKIMAKEFANRKIRVNAILPGDVDTDMFEKKNQMIGEEMKTQHLGVIPKENIARNIEYLLSEDSAYTTGEWMIIGGGRII